MRAMGYGRKTEQYLVENKAEDTGGNHWVSEIKIPLNPPSLDGVQRVKVGAGCSVQLSSRRVGNFGRK